MRIGERRGFFGMAQTIKDVMRKLQEKDYKLTPQRQLVAQVLLTNTGEHLSAEEIYQSVKDLNPEIGLATVYRTLELLSELEILQKIDFGDGRARYEFREEAHHHHHLICTTCGKVEEFGEDLLDSLEAQVSQQSGFRVTDHQVKFYGYCKDCQEKAARS